MLLHVGRIDQAMYWKRKHFSKTGHRGQISRSTSFQAIHSPQMLTTNVVEAYSLMPMHYLPSAPMETSQQGEISDNRRDDNTSNKDANADEEDIAYLYDISTLIQAFSVVVKMFNTSLPIGFQDIIALGIPISLLQV